MEPPNPSLRFRADCTECWLDPDVPSPSVGRRLLAGLLDVGVALLLASSALLLSGHMPPLPLAISVVFLGAALFLALMESLHGGGPAKTLLGLRVMDARGDRYLPLSRALRRSVALLLGAGMLPARSARCLCLGDQWADSNVFAVQALPRDLRSSPRRFQRALLCAGSLALVPSLAVLFYGLA